MFSEPYRTLKLWDSPMCAIFVKFYSVNIVNPMNKSHVVSNRIWSSDKFTATPRMVKACMLFPLVQLFSAFKRIIPIKRRYMITAAF